MKAIMKDTILRVRSVALLACMSLVVGTAVAGSDHTALTGDGSNNGMAILPSGFKLSSATYTVEAWINPSTITKESPIMDQFVGSKSGDWSFVVYGSGDDKGKIALLSRGVTTTGGASTWRLSNSKVSSLQWSHVAIAVDGETIKMYINGKLDVVHTISSGSTLPVSTGVFRIGVENRSSGISFSGKILDCRVWNTARTAEEIVANRFVRLAGTEQGLVAYWPLDEGEGASVVNKVSGATDTVTGAGFSWGNVRTPFETTMTSDDHALSNDGGAKARILADGFKISSEAFSLECWLYPFSLSSFSALFDQFASSAATGDLRLVVASAGSGSYSMGFFYRGFGAANWTYGSCQIPLYKWTHLAVSCDGDEAKLYVDGVLDATVARTAESRMTPVSSGELSLLGVYSSWDSICGQASDMRVWNRAISADEIASNRFVRLTGRETGLVGYWPLGEAEGNVATNWAAEARVMHDGTLSAKICFTNSVTPFMERSGEVDDACVLAGGRFNTQMRIWHPAYTLEGWAWISEYGNNVIFSQFTSDTSGSLRMTVNESGKLSGYLRNFISGNWVYSTATVPLRTWTHLALSYDGTTMKLYINGVKDSEFEGARIVPNGAAGLYVGGTADGSLSFAGRLCDARVWDVARTDAEIAASYNCRLTGKEPHLQGYWPLGQSSGGTVYNMSRQGVSNGAAAGELTWLSGRRTPFYQGEGLLILFR